jgi:hypothetical protein
MKLRWYLALLAAIYAIAYWLVPEYANYILLAGFGLGPGCCCGSSCAIVSDSFGANDISTNWTTASSGSWSISGGNLSTTSTSAYLINTTAHAGGIAAATATCTIAGSSGNIGRLIVGWKDSSHYIAAEIKFGSGGYIRLIQNGTTLSSFTGTFPTSATVTLCVTSDQSAASASTVDSGGTARFAQGLLTAPASGSQYVGVGTGATNSGGITFDSFSSSRTDNSCPPCVGSNLCALCSTLKSPIEIEMVWTGVAQSTVPGWIGVCDCSVINATYIVGYNSTSFNGTGQPVACKYTGANIDFSGTNSCIGQAVFFYNNQSPISSGKFVAQNDAGAQGANATATGIPTVPFNCISQAIPTMVGGVSPNSCDYSAWSVTATVIN